MLFLRRGLVVRRPPARLLGDLTSGVKRFYPAEGLLQDVIGGLDERTHILDQGFFVELVLLLVALSTGEAL